MTDAVEAVARSIAIGAYHRRYPGGKPDFIAGLVDRHWPEYQPDARLVLATINRLVQTETFEDAVADLPTVPAFLVSDQPQ